MFVTITFFGGWCLQLPVGTIDFCAVCGAGGNLLECEASGCGRVYHKGCCGAAGQLIDEDDDSPWSCPLHRCSKSKQVIPTGIVHRRTDVTEPYLEAGAPRTAGAPPRQLSLWRSSTTLRFFKLHCCYFCPARWLVRTDQSHDAEDPMTGVPCIGSVCSSCATPQSQLSRRIRCVVFCNTRTRARARHAHTPRARHSRSEATVDIHNTLEQRSPLSALRSSAIRSHTR